MKRYNKSVYKNIFTRLMLYTQKLYDLFADISVSLTYFYSIEDDIYNRTMCMKRFKNISDLDFKKLYTHFTNSQNQYVAANKLR